jgi:kynurenine formamidase
MVMWMHRTYDEARRILSNTFETDDPPFVWTSKMIQMNDHASTHVDALSHFGPNGGHDRRNVVRPLPRDEEGDFDHSL